MSDLPPGFVLDTPAPQQQGDLPPGFVLDSGPSAGMDVAKSAGIGLAKGPIDFMGLPGNAREMLARGGSKAAQLMGRDVPPEAFSAGLQKLPFLAGPTGQQIQSGLENVTGDFYKPQTTAGNYAQSAAEFASNPASYFGPGGAGMKAGGAVLSGLGSEAGGQATKGTAYEDVGRLGGALVGGMAGAKALGPTAQRAATPTLEDLKTAADRGYDAARNSGLEVHPQAIAGLASQVEQELMGPQYGFSPKVAGKTFDVLQELQSPPAGATFTASNIDALRKNLGHIAQEVQPAQGGFARPTPDAAAASIAVDRLKSYMASIPQSHVVAGDAQGYVDAIKQANGDYAAAMRLGNVDARLTKAENATDRQVAGSLDSQIKSKVGSMLDNPQRMRGLNQAEKDQIGLINGGTVTSNILRQLGRGGAGVVPMGAHMATAAMTGGASIPASLAIGVPLYAARKISEGMTKSRANKLAEMLAQRSPEYEARVNAMPPQSGGSPHAAALARALLAGAR